MGRFTLGLLLPVLHLASCAASVAADAAVYRQGDNVSVFYSASKGGKSSRLWLASRTRQEGIFSPRAGITEGWLPATVTSDVERSQCAADEACVQVRYLHQLFYSRDGLQAESANLTGEYRFEDVRPLSSVPPEKSLLPSLPEPAPRLCLLAFRWGGSASVPSSSEWGVFGSSASPSYVKGLLKHGLDPLLGRDYEVWTILVQSGQDLKELADAAPVAFAHHPVRRCQHYGALYFLFPTMYRERSEVHKLRGNDGAALVDAAGQYRAMERLEAVGIPTRFPHPANLYYILAGKTWLYHLSPVGAEWGLPPSVSVPRGLVEQDSEMAAKHAIALLERIKTMHGTPGEVKRGVAKLGFSWEALDVGSWTGVLGLAKVLREFFHAYNIQDQLRVLPHDTNNIIVQDYISHAIEMRVYVVEGRQVYTVYTKMKDIKGDVFGEFTVTTEASEASKSWLAGDNEALQDARAQASALIAKWMLWLEAQTSAPVAAVRFDFYVQAVSKGKVKLYIGEITENGFSMLHDKGDLGKKVFAAITKDALGELPLLALSESASAPQPKDSMHTEL
eukprot:TRINITY_DN25914_c0_g2_i2.p1 TRINITY_DN25914_c0_g2~~TRINITY_DN25914_c0_g2_i2.p1  ORF type:complete len:585 (+),score=105.16 TRINITY_DN25914_c0_g2_i2:71-1756(+)